MAWKLYRVIHVALPLGITQFPLNGYSSHCNGVHSKTTLSLFARLKGCFVFDSLFLGILFSIFFLSTFFFPAHACPFFDYSLFVSLLLAISRYFCENSFHSYFFTFLIPVDVFHLLSFKSYSN